MIEYLTKGKAKLIVSQTIGGKRRRYSKRVTYTTKRELNQLYHEFEKEVLHNPLVDTTVNELLDIYIRGRKVLGAKETTLQGYRTTAERLKSYFEGIDAKNLTSYQLQAVVTDMGELYAPKTIRNSVSLLSSAYDNAIKLGQLQNNPCRFVTLPRNKAKDIDIFSEEEIGTFIKALSNYRLDYIVAYKLALFCGLRRSEILGLKEEHVNTTFKVVSIKETRHRVEGQDYVQDTKTKSSTRTLALPDIVLSDIEELISQHNRFEYKRSDYLIQDGFGLPMTPSALTQTIYRIEDEAGLPHVSLHDLRHTFASMLNAEHVDISRISAELGHSSINTTLGIYTHVFGNVTESSRSIASAIDDKFSDPAETPLALKNA